MLAEQAQAEDLTSDALTQMRISFVERVFGNVQDLSRFMDVKAGYLLSAVALLTSALAIVGGGAFASPPQAGWRAWLPGVAAVFFLAYIVMAMAMLYSIVRVFRARAHSSLPPGAAPGLVFPLELLTRYQAEGSKQSYYARLNAITAQDILHDFANQVVIVSGIYQEKQREINRSTSLFVALGVFWVITLLLLLAIVVGE